MKIIQARATVFKGKITNEEGFGLPGTNIIIKGTTKGTQTDFDGNYTLLTYKNEVMVISYKGYKTQEVKMKNKKENELPRARAIEVSK